MEGRTGNYVAKVYKNFGGGKPMNEKQSGFGKVLCFFLCFFAFFTLLTAQAAGDSRLIRVGWYEDSYHLTGTNGERSGYGYEFEQAVSSYTGWNYSYVKAGWDDLLHMVAKGDIDLMGAVSYTPERAQQMLFSDLPMGTEKYLLYANVEGSNISSENLESLNGKRICLLRGSVQATQFIEWEEKHQIHTEHVYVDSFPEGKQLAEAHQIDGVISTETPLWTTYGMHAVATTGGGGIYFAINPHRPELKAELDKAMRQMEQDKPFYTDELYQRFLSAVSSTVMNREEKAWLSSHGAIRIGWLKQDVGVSLVNPATGKPVGILNDYVKFASDTLGPGALSFELVGFDTIEEEMMALKQGDIDVIFHFTQNPYVAEQNRFILSNTAWSTNLCAITTNGDFSENTIHKVAVQKGDLLLQWYLAYNYPRWDIVLYDSLEDMEKAIKTGEVDCFFRDSGQMNKYIKDTSMNTIFLSKPGNISFATDRENTMLMSILNKTMRNMPYSLLTGALSMYENAAEKVTVEDFIKDNLLSVATISFAVFAVIVFLILRLLRKSQKAEAKAKLAACNAKQSAVKVQKLNDQLQKSQKDLEAALQQAEQANKAKSYFLFNMSHDIRTPMNAILGYTKLMKQELTSPKLLDYQEKMEQAGNLLLSIINNVLDMARIESGKMELDENYAEANDVLEEVYDVFHVEAEKRGVAFTKEVHISHPHVLCDRTKVQEVLTNLISNAIKYTHKGGRIHLSLRELPPEKEGTVRIETCIKDTGIGMSKEYLPHLFDAFTRERNTTKAKVGGTGLGMAIVKKLVDLMGGTITVESELGKGSTFTVVLTHSIADEAYYKKAAEIADTEESSVKIQGKHILLAEDNDLNAEIAVALLEMMDLTVYRVSDGIQCVKRMEEMPAGTYDMILMDIQMPYMDGYQATETIRHFTDPKKANIPIIAMTANAFEEDRKRALAKGMNGHIAKPIDVKQMESVMSEVLK